MTDLGRTTLLVAVVESNDIAGYNYSSPEPKQLQLRPTPQGGGSPSIPHAFALLCLALLGAASLAQPGWPADRARKSAPAAIYGTFAALLGHPGPSGPQLRVGARTSRAWGLRPGAGGIPCDRRGGAPILSCAAAPGKCRLVKRPGGDVNRFPRQAGAMLKSGRACRGSSGACFQLHNGVVRKRRARNEKGVGRAQCPKCTQARQR